MSIKDDIKAEVEGALEALGLRDPGVEVSGKGWSTVVVTFRVGGSEIQWIVPADPVARLATLGRMTDYLLKETDCLNAPIPRAIRTIEDAIAATEQGLASCYGRDDQGGDWVGFGRPRRTGHIPRVYLPASAAEVERCQHVQRRHLRFLEREAEPVAVRPANDAEHDGGIGPRGASAATVEAEVRRACAAYPEIGDLEFSFLPNPRPTRFCGLWSTRVMVNGHELHVYAFTFDGLRSGAHELAKVLLSAYDRERRASCTTCQTLATVLCPCPVCGGVGS